MTDAEENYENPDRISMLPDCILLQILNRVPMQSVVRTSILAKRWKHLWKFVDCLSFDSEDFLTNGAFRDREEKRRCIEEFTSFITNTLLFRDPSAPIKGFRLRFYEFTEYLKPLIDIWLHMIVLKKNLIELIMTFNSAKEDQFYRLPRFFFGCSSIEILDLENCIVTSNPVVSWNHLNLMSMRRVRCEGNDIAIILSGCPMLETLLLYDFGDFGRLSVTSPKLRRLKLKIFDDEEKDAWLEIHAPYLEELDISGCLYNLKCRITDGSSLVSAKFTFQNDTKAFGNGELDDLKEYENMVLDLLKSVQHVKQVTIGSWFLQILSILEFKGLLQPLVKWKHLKLKGSMTTYEVFGIARLLIQTSPQLETCSVYISNLQGKLAKYFKKLRIVKLQSGTYKFSMQSLKIVEFTVTYGYCLSLLLKEGEDRFYDSLVAAFLLKNARALSKLVVRSRSEGCIWCKPDCAAARISQIAQKAVPIYFPQTESVVRDLSRNF